RQRLLDGRAGSNHAPQATVDDDRRRDRRTDAHLAHADTARARAIGNAVDPRRATGLRDDPPEVLPPWGQPTANGKVVVRPAGSSENSQRTVGLVAPHAREINRKQPDDLVGDRREHLRRWHTARYQGRDAP